MLELQSTSVSPCPWHICYHPIPRRFHPHYLQLSRRRAITIYSPAKSTQNYFANKFFFTLTAKNSCSNEQNKKKNKQNTSYPNQNHALLEELHSFIATNNRNDQTQKAQRKEEKVKTNSEVNSEVISTNMWWADLKAALGQRINLEGIVYSVGVLGRDKNLAIPHVAVPDIRYIDWAELKRKGFRGVVFDKDNTITVPYSLTLWGPLGSSLERCKSEFGDNIAVFSNSVGLYEYDPDGRKASGLEGAIGIKVIRHRVKKPAGTAEEIERHFGCESSRLIMVGDRPFTDVVYGNRNGFLTILTEPLSLAEEPFIVKQVRKLEVAFVNRWCRKGLKPSTHMLLQEAQQCLKDLPPPVRNVVDDD